MREVGASVKRYKYPRTPHTPDSPGATSDDVRLSSLAHFNSKYCVISQKLDGENTTLYRDYIHARSVDGRHHPSRSWVKQLHSGMSHLIPKGWRICGENLYAKHSIFYSNLPSYFFAFSVWNDKNICLSWSETVEWCKMMGLEIVPYKLFRFQSNGQVSLSIPTSGFECWTDETKTEKTSEEGYVLRTADYSFSFDDFNLNMAKYVRANHVQTSEHWMHSKIIPNELSS